MASCQWKITPFIFLTPTVSTRSEGMFSKTIPAALLIIMCKIAMHDCDAKAITHKSLYDRIDGIRAEEGSIVLPQSDALNKKAMEIISQCQKEPVVYVKEGNVESIIFSTSVEPTEKYVSRDFMSECYRLDHEHVKYDNRLPAESRMKCTPATFAGFGHLTADMVCQSQKIFMYDPTTPHKYLAVYYTTRKDQCDDSFKYSISISVST